MIKFKRLRLCKVNLRKMLLSKVLNRIKPQRQCVYLLQTHFSQRMQSSKSINDDQPTEPKTKTKQALGEIGSKYQIFKDEDSEVILDIYEDRSKYGNLLENDPEEHTNPLDGINLERGLEGVYDIEDLVALLQRENAQDIFVAAVPKEIKYVNYICVVTGKSNRHMQAIAQFIKTVYKKKMNKKDIVPKIEGGDSKDWLALDLGNIALHIFSPQARILYDLDSLWSVGPQYDAEYNRQDPVAEMLEKHSIYLQDLRPAS